MWNLENDMCSGFQLYLTACDLMDDPPQTFSHIWLLATHLQARQAPLSMGSSEQEYWSRLTSPSPEDLWLSYSQSRNRDRDVENMYDAKGKGGWDDLGVRDWHMYITDTVYKTDD